MKPTHSSLHHLLSIIQRFLKKLTVITSDVYGLDKTFRVLQYGAHLLSLYTSHQSKLHQASRHSVAPLSEGRFAVRLFSLVHLLAHPSSSWSYRSLVVYAYAELMYWCGAHGIAKVRTQYWSQLSCLAWAMWIGLEWKWQPTSAQWVSQCCDLPLALHWSRSTPLLHENTVAWLGFVGGVASFWKSWRSISIHS